MEEELNENELEERLYAMLYYGDGKQKNDEVNTNQDDILRIIGNAPCSTIRRYWHINDAQNVPTQKVNTSKETATVANNHDSQTNADKAKPKEERRETHAQSAPAVDLTIFQSPVPRNIQKSIEILENDEENCVVELQSSDEDEVIVVALPPKPTITIESSDEEELKNDQQTTKNDTQSKLAKENKTGNNNSPSTSPVPSIVSSVSDEFIRSDCIALNISSRYPENHSFDFSLHGSDLLDKSTPSKKKKKKKNKECATSTPVSESTPKTPATNVVREQFATPKSKVKDKQINKSYIVSRKSIQNADVYDSDSNQSIIDMNKTQKSYSVTEKSLPSADVYDSDSSEIVKSTDQIVQPKADQNKSSYTYVSQNIQETPKNSKRNNSTGQIDNSVVDLTDDIIMLDDSAIEENIFMANVTGFDESEDYGDEINITKDITGSSESKDYGDSQKNESPKLGSTKVPAILYEDLDFDNLKGKGKVCRRRRYSLTTLRAEMEKFYNESWGGEDFNHREIQKYMSRDKSLWVIDPKDRMASTTKRKIVCNYCNRAGHRDDTCRMKPPVCHMCGSTGHYEPRCPSKICVNCGSPNYVYSTICRNCSTWGRITCSECGQKGHPASHCPDTWRRYHNTIDDNTPLEENRQTKRQDQLFCSGCTRRGHLIHTCRLSLPFSGLPINSPYVALYRPIYSSTSIQKKSAHTNNNNLQRNNKQLIHKTFPQDSTISSGMTIIRGDRCKRQSKSPTLHESHVNKKRNLSISNDTEENANDKSSINNSRHQRKRSQSKEPIEDTNKVTKETNKTLDTGKTIEAAPEKAPDFIPINSTNHDKKGQMIQDNEVSDTSDIVTSARIYVTNEIIDKLKTEEGQNWLSETTKSYNITIEHTDVSSFLNIKGKVGDQEDFQGAMRDWAKPKPNKELKSDNETDISQEFFSKISQSHNIPKNRNNVLRKLSKAFETLKHDLGDPNAIYKELTYLQNHHQNLLREKVINPKQLQNNRSHINEMCRKLNIVLLGQAGLADGTKHINELYSLQEKLTNFRQKNISVDLRQEIGQHYHCIFTCEPRDDYADLLKKYYCKQSLVMFKKKKRKENFLKISAKPIQKNFALKQRNKFVTRNVNNDGDLDSIKNYELRKPLVEKTMNKLVFYHRRVLHARPFDSILQKKRLDLVRKLHGHIASLSKYTYVSSKTMKKMKKLQEQAQLFLINA